MSTCSRQACSVEAKPGKRLRALIGMAVIFMAFALVGAFSGLRGSWSPTDLLDRLRGFGVWTPVILCVIGVLSPFLLLPRWPLASAACMIYGLGWGALLANTASTFGALLQFLAGRSLFGEKAADWLNRRGYVIADLPGREAFSLLLALRVFPFSNFVATNLAMASISISARAFLMGTFLGMLPSTFIYGAWGRMATHPSRATYGVSLLLCALAVVPGFLAHRGIRKVKRD